MKASKAKPDSLTENKLSRKKSARRFSRELALQGLYQWRVAGGSAVDIIKQLRESEEFKQTDKDFFVALWQGTTNNVATLEQEITPHIDRPMKELSPVEYAILLLGAQELSAHLEIPYRVVINEAVELAKTFGGTDGHKYINGVLDKLAAKLRAVEINAST